MSTTAIGPVTSEPTNLTDAQIDAGLFATNGYALAPGEFTYSIPTASSIWPDYDPGSEPYTNYAAFNATQAAQFSAAIALWDSYIAPSFTQVADSGDNGFIRAAFTGDHDTSDYGYAYQGNGVGAQSGQVGDIWINDTGTAPGAFDFSAGAYGFEALLHEIGHTLGLKHSFEAPVIPEQYDSRRYTIMSYTDPTDNVLMSFLKTPGGTIYSTPRYVNPQTPMVLDIQAVQDLYGVDPNTNAGDTVYRFTDADWTKVWSLYDASGNDTIDLSALTRGSILDLRPGAYSSIDQWSIQDQENHWIAQYGANYTSFIDGQFDSTSYTGHDNLGLSFSTTIENAIGSSGDDVITANDFGDHIDGGGGDDILIGGAGAVLTGGAGLDVFENAFENETVTDMVTGEYFLVTGGVGYNTYQPYNYAASTLSIYSDPAQTVHVAINPSSYFAAHYDFSGGDYVVRLYAHDDNHSDFNGDAQSDLILTGSDGTTVIDDVQGENYPEFPYYVGAFGTVDGTPQGWSIQGSLDIDDDHVSDLLWRNNVTGQIAVWENMSHTAAANGSLAFNESAYLSGPVSLDWQIAAVADVNDDGRDDVIWRKADGTVTTWLSTGTSFDNATPLYGVAGSWHIQGAADVNGDGFADLVWRNDSGLLTTWLSQGNGFSTDTPILSVDKSWHVDAVADVTGDGIADLLWRNDNGAISVWSGTANGFIQNTYYHAPIGNAWHIVDTGDYNGDGKADILWQNDNGAISIWQSTGSGSAAGFIEGAYTDNTIAQGQTIVTTHHDII